MAVEAFPFTDAEWDRLKPVALSILDADAAEDEVLVASLRLDMLELVDGLRERYGDHPVLLETAADYTEEPAERVPLYRRAVAIAEANGLPTLSIRIALASTLTELGDPPAAVEELRACGSEAADAGEDERTQWLDRLREAAGYTEGDTERSRVYRLAVAVAATHGLPTYPIRLCFARHLLDAGQPAAAREELWACRGEMPGADDDDRVWWASHLEEASRAEHDAAPDRGGQSASPES